MSLLILSVKSFLPGNVTHSQLLGIGCRHLRGDEGYYFALSVDLLTEEVEAGPAQTLISLPEYIL